MADPATTPETPAPKKLADALERIAQLEAQLASQRAMFDASWAARERDIEELLGRAATRPDAESTPRGPLSRGKIARFDIHCHDAQGAKLFVARGKPIPEGANLDGVDAAAIVEES